MSLDPKVLVGRTITAVEWVKASQHSEEDTLRVTFSDGCVVDLVARTSWDDAYLTIEVVEARTP